MNDKEKINQIMKIYEKYEKTLNLYDFFKEFLTIIEETKNDEKRNN